MLTRRPRQRTAALAVAAALLSACTPAPTSTPAAPAPSSSAAPSASSSPTLPSTSPFASRSPSSAAGSAATDALTLAITIRDGQVTPNGKKINVGKGQPVVLTVTSDVEDEVHAHTDDDGYELAVRPGTPARGQFVITEAGRYEVELHELGKIVAILVVR